MTPESNGKPIQPGHCYGPPDPSRIIVLPPSAKVTPGDYETVKGPRDVIERLKKERDELVELLETALENTLTDDVLCNFCRNLVNFHGSINHDESCWTHTARAAIAKVKGGG